MKNKNILKVFGIAFLVTLLLSWIIPSTIIGSEGLETGAIATTGFADIFSSIDVITYYFAQPSIFILFVGIFYGIINKSGMFKSFVNTVSSKFNEKKDLFVILTILFYTVTTALTGIYLPMFMFIPMSIAILFELKYSKSDAVLSTVGASTIGLLAQINNNMINQMANSTANKYLFVKIGLLVVLTVLLTLYVLIIGKKNNEKHETSSTMFIPMTRKATKEKNVGSTGMFIIISLLFVVFVLGLTPWANNGIFTKAYDAIKSVNINGFKVFSSILGVFEVFGTWTYSSLFPTVALASIVAAIVGKLSLSETTEASMSGMKRVSGLALLAAIINMILIIALNSGFVGTIIRVIAKSENPVLITISSLISNVFMVDMTYAAQYVMSMFYYALSPKNMEFIGLIVQLTYGFSMLIVPSSILLLLGLWYVEEDYSKWFKYIWRLLVVVFIAVLIAITVAAMI